MKYILNNSLYVFNTTENGVILSVNKNDLVSVSAEKEKEVISILKVFIKPYEIETAFREISKSSYIDRDNFLENVSFMIENNILKQYQADKSNNIINEYQREKYKRQISSLNSIKGIETENALEMQKRILDSKICVIGVGGTGSYLALALAMIGVRNLVLVDFDKIELSNTSRQILYTESDVGKYKIDVAKEKLKLYSKDLVINTYNTFIDSIDKLNFIKKGEVDLIVSCADTPRGKIQYIIDEVSQKEKIPWLFYGPYKHDQIRVGPLFVPGKSKSYNDLFPRTIINTNEDIESINKNFTSNICDPYNGMASQIVAIEIFKFLTGVSESQLIGTSINFDTDNWVITKEKYE